MKAVFLFFLALIAAFCAHAQALKDTIKKNTVHQFQYFIITSKNKTFGYDIYKNGNLYIHQPVVPGLHGNAGFTDTGIAKKCALLVIKKLKQGEVLPSVSLKELDALGLKRK